MIVYWNIISSVSNGYISWQKVREREKEKHQELNDRFYTAIHLFYGPGLLLVVVFSSCLLNVLYFFLFSLISKCY